MVPTLQAPFTYEALPPEQINFVPLKQKKSFNAKELMHCLKQQVALDAVAQAQCQVAARATPLAQTASCLLRQEGSCCFL